MSTAPLNTILSDLHKWLEERNFNPEALGFLVLIESPVPSEGRCVIAKRPIPANTELLTFPCHLLINYRFAFADNQLSHFIEWVAAKASHGECERLSRLDALYLLLLVHRFDATAPLYRFVASMPHHYDTPEYFANVCVASLPTLFRGDVQRRIDQLAAKQHRMYTLLAEYIKKRANCFEDSSMQRLLDHLNFENWRWAFCSVNSRCFHIKETNLCSEEEQVKAHKLFGPLSTVDKYQCTTIDEFEDRLATNQLVANNQCCLIPYLDFLNHSYARNAHARFDGARKLFVLQSLSAETSRDGCVNESLGVDSGQQVYVTYGEHDNRTLLIEYGFVIDGNHNERVIFLRNDFDEVMQTKLGFSEETVARFWKTCITNKFVDDMSCNDVFGPSWCLLRSLELINKLHTTACKRRSPASQRNKVADSTQNEKTRNDSIKDLFEHLLHKHEQDLHVSIARLNGLLATSSCNEYHIEMSLTCSQSYLRIVEFNLKLINDNEQWSQLLRDSFA